jgi:hypothetical protein
VTEGRKLEDVFRRPARLSEHPLIDEMRREVTWLRRRGFSGTQARKMIRAEVDREVAYSLRYVASLYDVMPMHRPPIGSFMQFEAIDIYVVDELPAECGGYRVINPMREP